MHGQTTINVTIYHCDYFGHVNNSVYLDFMQQAISERLPIELHAYLSPKRCRVDYIKPILFGERIIVHCWITEAASFFQIMNQEDQVAVKARIEWVFHPELASKVKELDNGTSVEMDVKKLKNNKDETKGKPFFLPVYVASRDLTTGGFCTTAAFMRWSEIGFESAAQKSGWSAGRNLSLNWISYAISQDLEVFVTPKWDDVIVIKSYLHDAKKIRGVWRHDFIQRDTNELLAINYVGGAFLNLQGQVTEPPTGLLDDCFQGERA